jgi:hypothetical protein
MTCKSVGWVIGKNRLCIVVVPHISLNTVAAEQQGCGDMTIPTASIVRIMKINAAFPSASLVPDHTRTRF